MTSVVLRRVRNCRRTIIINFIFVFHSNYASIYYRKPHIGRKLLPPIGGEAVRFDQRPLVMKTRMMDLSDSERISMMLSAILTQSTRVMDRIGVAYTCYSIYAVARKYN